MILNEAAVDVREYLTADVKNPLLLIDGDKSTQASDVARALESWKAHQEDKRVDAESAPPKD
jgi:hypothetical protein